MLKRQKILSCFNVRDIIEAKKMNIKNAEKNIKLNNFI